MDEIKYDSDKQRVEEYNNKAMAKEDIETEMILLVSNSQMKIGAQTWLKCKSLDNIYDQVMCLDYPELTKKFADLDKQRQRKITEMRAMELGN